MISYYKNIVNIVSGIIYLFNFPTPKNSELYTKLKLYLSTQYLKRKNKTQNAGIIGTTEPYSNPICKTVRAYDI